MRFFSLYTSDMPWTDELRRYHFTVNPTLPSMRSAGNGAPRLIPLVWPGFAETQKAPGDEPGAYRLYLPPLPSGLPSSIRPTPLLVKPLPPAPNSH